MLINRNRKLTALVSMLLLTVTVSALVAPSYAYTTRYVKIGSKYLTVEYSGCRIEIWWRQNPCTCSIGDKIVARLTCSDVYSAYKAAQQCFMCISWILGSYVCTQFTLPGIATTLVCSAAYGGAILECSKCGADVLARLISSSS